MPYGKNGKPGQYRVRTDVYDGQDYGLRGHEDKGRQFAHMAVVEQSSQAVATIGSQERGQYSGNSIGPIVQAKYFK